MKNSRIYISLWIALIFPVVGCVQTQRTAQTEKAATREPVVQASQPIPAPVNKTKNDAAMEKDRKGYLLKPIELEMKAGRPYLPVGAEIISKDGKVPLIQVIHRLAELKGFSVSWADDVNSNQAVDVHLRPEDNFWEALDNILRQLDYFYELEKETIVVKYKEAKRYLLVMPTLKENFKTSVGGNLIGGEAQGRLKGQTEMQVDINEPLDFWKNVSENIDKIINSGEQRTVQTSGQQAAPASGPTYDKGFFILDKNLGIVTVTAPRKTHNQVLEYIDNLKKHMYRQVVIEAKIIEVLLDDSHQYGVNWADLLSRTFTGAITFGEAGVIYPYHHQEAYNKLKFIDQITLNAQTFEVIIDALKTYGETNILANPKVTLMSGHGATLTVGENVTYVDKVTSVTDENGNVTFTVSTATVLSGIGMAVMANIIDEDDVILYVTPITSSLTEPIEKEVFGAGLAESRVGLPRVRLRELATMSRIKNGETLILGGHIDSSTQNSTSKVPLFGDIPVLGWLFKHETRTTVKRELAIFIQPRIISF